MNRSKAVRPRRSNASWCFIEKGLLAMDAIFGDMDLEEFWERSDYAQRQYEDDPPTDEQVAAVERELGYKLPKSYVELMKRQNGGIPRRPNHRTLVRTTWAEDHIAITGIFSIGSTKRYALCGRAGSRFWIDEWGYPPIGVYFADCPSGGHDMLCLNYQACGPDGEPWVVHVDQDNDYTITFLADNFASFIRGLESEEAFKPGG